MADHAPVPAVDSHARIYGNLGSQPLLITGITHEDHGQAVELMLKAGQPRGMDLIGHHDLAASAGQHVRVSLARVPRVQRNPDRAGDGTSKIEIGSA